MLSNIGGYRRAQLYILHIIMLRGGWNDGEGAVSQMKYKEKKKVGHLCGE